MGTGPLPKTCAELLEIPKESIPDLMRELIHSRRLTPLMQRINTNLTADDPALRARAKGALAHLGFAE